MSSWKSEFQTNTDVKPADLASGTFEGYVSGTVTLVFCVFFVFLLLSVLTAGLMGYARYMARRKTNTPGFFNPPKLFKKATSNVPMQSSGQSTVL